MRILSLVLILISSLYVSAREYPVTIEKVKDGDTFTCSIDLGFNVNLNHQVVRFSNFDAWELSKTRKTIVITADEIEKGKIAKQELIRIFSEAKSIYVSDEDKIKKDVYGRLLLRVFVDGKDVGNQMIELGHQRQ